MEQGQAYAKPNKLFYKDSVCMKLIRDLIIISCLQDPG